jgi:DNA-binding response OmpR family regulator
MSGTSGSYVLVVEDDADLSAIMTLALSTAGYAAHAAQDGREALDMIAREMPSLILLDMNMPNMNGEQFLSIFRERHGHQAPVVVVTAADQARQEAAQIGAEGALTKPFELPTFLKTVSKFLGAAPRRSPLAGDPPTPPSGSRQR